MPQYSTDKIWAMYVADAERIDKALAESWRGDMDGILIFVSDFQFYLHSPK